MNRTKMKHLNCCGGCLLGAENSEVGVWVGREKLLFIVKTCRTIWLSTPEILNRGDFAPQGNLAPHFLL